ncbi:hypothetical protein VKT23_020456 [Stygiomarasmius scandens]|uniref:Uncharacterized protein n=1 Tax=Marasmiellus scandens TaxID=2682957 RepID=A0ABR1IN07_9AGAR
MNLQARLALTALVLSTQAWCQSVVIVPKQFLTLPLGQVRPSGWLFDQLMVQTNGLAGHEHEFYHYVSQTDWLGGDSFYSSLEEAGSYWFNAMVPNGVLANSSVLNEKTAEFLDYVISHQDSTGWLGPERLEPANHDIYGEGGSLGFNVEVDLPTKLAIDTHSCLAQSKWLKLTPS